MPRNKNKPRGDDPTPEELATRVSDLEIAVAALRKTQQEREKADTEFGARIRRLAYMVERKLGPIGVEELGL